MALDTDLRIVHGTTFEEKNQSEYDASIDGSEGDACTTVGGSAISDVRECLDAVAERHCRTGRLKDVDC